MKKNKSKKKPAQRSLKQQRHLMSDIRRLIGKNYTDYEIMEQLEIRPDDLSHYKQQILRNDKDVLENLDSVGVYSDYLLKSRQMVKELDELKVKFRNKGQWTALVAAVKQKKEIYDSVIKMGQDFGFIEKKATEFKVSGEMSFSTMSEKEVKEEIQKEVENIQRLSTGVIDMRPELLGVMPEEVRKFIPQKLLENKNISKTKIKTKAKTKIKFIVRKR